MFDQPPTEAIKIWPEFSDIHMLDIPKEYRDYQQHGMPILAVDDLVVVSIPEGSEDGLKILIDEVHDNYVACVSVRPNPGAWVDWWARLGQNVTSLRGVSVAWHNRHDVLECMGLRQYRIGVIALDRCAEYLRSEGIEASTEAMRSEKAVTKAIETLRATGFRAPRKR